MQAEAAVDLRANWNLGHDVAELLALEDGLEDLFGSEILAKDSAHPGIQADPLRRVPRSPLQFHDEVR
jgi:hypothetical protein